MILWAFSPVSMAAEFSAQNPSNRDLSHPQQIAFGTQLVVFCSLGLTAFAVLGHILQVRAKSQAQSPADSNSDSSAADAAPTKADTTAIPVSLGDGVQPAPYLPQGSASGREALRRRSSCTVHGREGSKPASLPLQKLIEVGDTTAVQKFVSRNPPELVRELFNTGDPALNGTTPLLLAVRLGEDSIINLLLVRLLHV